jgi:hypothetical protein
MASLGELFKGEEHAMTMSVDTEVTLTDPSGAVVCKATTRAYSAYDVYACFMGYYVTEQFATEESLLLLIAKYDELLGLARNGVESTTSHPLFDPIGTSSNELPFTGRVYLYVEATLGEPTKERLRVSASNAGLHLQIRDRSYESFVNANERPLGFISHDSRDKATFVEPLASRLRSVLCPVWYDAYSLKPGDSLTASIDAGLRDSKRCVIVLSPNFLTNPGWGKGEFNAAVNKHFSSGGNVLLPIWHGVTRSEVAEYSPLIADIVAINSDLGADEVFSRLHRALLAD